MIIQSDWKRYNANTRNAHTGDCVKRAISLALGEDYDKIASDLNKIAREMGEGWKFNHGSVFNSYLKLRGYPLEAYRREENGQKYLSTVDQFCDAHTQGVYILWTGKRNQIASGVGNHLCCVINGDVYDTWDSRNELIYKVATVSEASTEFRAGNIHNVSPIVMDFIREYVAQINEKNPLIGITLRKYGSDNSIDYYHIDTETFKFALLIHIDESVSAWSEYSPGCDYLHNFVMKLNPRASDIENIKSLQKKAKQKIYDYIYNVRKEVTDSNAIHTAKYHPSFSGNRKLLVNLPEWVQSRTLQAYDLGESNDFGRYDVVIEADPDDPRYNKSKEVYFRTDTLRELKDQLKEYKDTFNRPDWDY